MNETNEESSLNKYNADFLKRFPRRLSSNLYDTKLLDILSQSLINILT